MAAEAVGQSPGSGLTNAALPQTVREVRFSCEAWGMTEKFGGAKGIERDTSVQGRVTYSRHSRLTMELTTPATAAAPRSPRSSPSRLQRQLGYIWGGGASWMEIHLVWKIGGGRWELW